MVSERAFARAARLLLLTAILVFSALLEVWQALAKSVSNTEQRQATGVPGRRRTLS